MLRYKVYQIVTHKHFPFYAFISSIFLYLAALYVLSNPPLLNLESFISENALSPNYQSSHIDSIVTSTSLKDFSQFQNSSIFYFYHKSPRTTKKDCICLLFEYNSGKLGIQLALTIKKFVENQIWGGDILFVVYKKSKWAKEFRSFHFWSLGKFGVVRAYFDLDIDEKYSYLSINPNGINGVQTDLDQVQAVLILLRKVNIEFRFPEGAWAPAPKLYHTMGSFYKIIRPDFDSPHSYLLGEGFVALKIFTVAKSKSTTISPLYVSQFLELIVRTFTGLDENLHAGYYFYFFTSSNHVMPLSKSGFLVGALVSPLLFQSVLILKKSWFCFDAIFNLVLPYVTGVCCYLIGIRMENFVYWSLVPLMGNLCARRTNQIFKAYSNLALGTCIVAISSWSFPLALLLCLLVPFKILIPPWRSWITFYSSLGALLGFGLMIPFNDLLETEQQSGHFSFFIILCGILPCFWHFIYLFR